MSSGQILEVRVESDYLVEMGNFRARIQRNKTALIEIEFPEYVIVGGEERFVGDIASFLRRGEIAHDWFRLENARVYDAGVWCAVCDALMVVEQGMSGCQFEPFCMECDT